MRVNKPTVSYKLAPQKKSQAGTLTYYYKNTKQLITQQGSIEKKNKTRDTVLKTLLTTNNKKSQINIDLKGMKN